jgi:ABC-2 type transport system ATP-binding protein
MITKLSKKGKIIFYCSHLLDIMEKVSDRIIIIENGRIKINELKKDLELNQNYSSLNNIFRSISENNSNKEFFYDEVFS